MEFETAEVIFHGFGGEISGNAGEEGVFELFGALEAGFGGKGFGAEAVLEGVMADGGFAGGGARSGGPLRVAAVSGDLGGGGHGWLRGERGAGVERCGRLRLRRGG